MPSARQTAIPDSLYERLMALPEGLTGEILDGRLHTQPRPSGAHMGVESALQIELGGPFDRGRGGPGGWRILVEPEVHFLRDQEVSVPDLAGWRRERLPKLPNDQRFEVVPDWVCEILSPSTERQDRLVKMPLYARHGVPHAWLIDPLKHRIEVFVLEAGAWRHPIVACGDTRITAPPFEAVPLSLGDLWA